MKTTRIAAIAGLLALAFTTGFTCSKSENKPAENPPPPAQEQLAAPAAAPAPTEVAPPAAEVPPPPEPTK